jgi:dipeptidyl aminopeptidase/acylaminoacyl peptidase
MLKRNLAIRLFVVALAIPGAQQVMAEPTYRKPPANVERVLRAESPPQMWLNSSHDYLIQVTPVRYPPIADLARPMLRLAGVRVVPANRSIQNQSYSSSYDLVKVADGSLQHISLPNGGKAGSPLWSPDGRKFAFTLTTTTSIQLYLGDVNSTKPRQLKGIQLNPFFGYPIRWMPDSRTLLVRQVPSGQRSAPSRPEAPLGPNISEATGVKGASSTYEVRDVLKSPYDEKLFDYYGETQLALIDTSSGQTKQIGPPALYSQASPSPDGRLILIATEQRPYSYLTTHDRFPKEVDIWDISGKKIAHIASLPAADRVPTWGCPVGPRDFSWRATAPATLLWAEALDSGDFKKAVPERDKLMQWKFPFSGAPTDIAHLPQRFGGFSWLPSGAEAIVTDFDPVKHWTRTYLIDTAASQPTPKLLWERSTDDRYGDPGSLSYRSLPNGQSVVEQQGDSVFLRGAGASPEGDRPFLDRYDLKTQQKTRLFRSERNCYESFAAWADPSKGQFFTRYESPNDPPNLYLRSIKGPLSVKAAIPIEEAVMESTKTRAITKVSDATPEIRGITKRLVTYKRADGVDLSFTLYLPAGYQEGTKLPAVLWAYPLDYADAKAAGQVSGSTQHFTQLGWPLQLFFLLDGYAVIDNPSMPVIGDPNKIYDTYMEQLVSGAQAAVDKAVELGCVDRDRIGVTGHSHGGLMTANLLANTNLFKAGVARSGAYNRTLTAFGFQNERRTLWEAPEVYAKVSTFFHADQVKYPLLLIHGEADANPGTVPLQSQTMFEAIRGNGGVAKLVMLPYESHGYSAMESNEHVIYEMLEWFNRYVKNAPTTGK